MTVINPNKTFTEYMENKHENTKTQQCGVDITIAKVKKISGCVEVSEKIRTSPTHTEVPLINNYYVLEPGIYDVEFYEHIKIPKDVCGFIIQRSTLNRSGCRVLSSWFDAGFENVLGAIMEVHIPIKIEIGTRIAQLILFEAESASTYCGIYQKQPQLNAMPKDVWK